MAIHQISSVEVGKETAFGDLDSDFLPLKSTPTFAALPCTRAAFFDGFSEPNYDFDGTIAGHYAHLREAETVINNTGGARWDAADTKRIRRLMSEGIVLEGPIMGVGAAATYYTGGYVDWPWNWLLESSCGVVIGNPSTDTIAAAGTAVSFTVTTAASWDIGHMVAWDNNNAREYSCVTNRAGAVITVSPAFSAIPQIGDTIQICRTLYPAVGTSATSVVVRFTMDNRRRYAWGCRCASFTFSRQGGTIMGRATMLPAVVLTDDAIDTVVGFNRPEGAHAQWLGAYHVLSAVHDGGVPGDLARTALALSNWETTIDFGLSAEAGGSESILGRANTEVGVSLATAVLTSEPSPTFEDMLRLRERRNLVLGTGPTGVGQGFGVAIMSAQSTESVNVQEGDNGRQSSTVNLTSGQWDLDNASTAAGNTSWRIGFVETSLP